MSKKEIKREQQIVYLTNIVYDRYAKKGILLNEHIVRKVQNHIWNLYKSGKRKGAKLFALSCKLDLFKMQEVMA